MNFTEGIDFLNKCERELPVNEWKIDGSHVWPLLRIDISFKLYDLSSSNNTSHCNIIAYIKSICKPLFNTLKIKLLDRQHENAIAPADVFIMGDMERRNFLTLDGTKLDYVLDPINKVLTENNIRVLRCENTKGYVHIPRFTNSVIIDSSMLKLRLLSRFKSLFCRIDHNIEMSGYDELILWCKRLNIVPFNIASLCSTIEHMHNLEKYYIEILQRVKPKVVIYTLWYAADMMAFSSACHKCNIPVIEIQHGMAGGSGSHAAYNKWCNIPKEGYGGVPDYFWAWTEADKQAFDEWNGPHPQAFVAGQPSYMLWGDEVFRNKYNALLNPSIVQGKKHLLVSLQFGTVLPDWLAVYINEHKQYQWWIRFHPRVDKAQTDFVKKLSNAEHIDIDTPNRLPLEILLANCVANITSHSSVVVDAVNFGIKSIVINNNGQDAYSKEIATGNVLVALTAKEMDFAIGNIEKKTPKKDRFREKCVESLVGINTILKLLNKSVVTDR